MIVATAAHNQTTRSAIVPVLAFIRQTPLLDSQTIDAILSRRRSFSTSIGVLARQCNHEMLVIYWTIPGRSERDQN